MASLDERPHDHHEEPPGEEPRGEEPRGEEPPGDDRYARPAGADDALVAAAGKVSEAVEWVERARGRLYDFHQMIGRADLVLEEGADALADAGRDDLAQQLRTQGIGRNVLEGRWTFQVVDEFDDLYWKPIRALEEMVRTDTMAGRRHIYEAEMKERRRTRGHPDHRSRPER